MNNLLPNTRELHDRIRATDTKSPRVQAPALAYVASVRAGMESRRNQAQVLRVVESHQDIVDAIAAADPKGAGTSMARHFEETEYRAFTRATGDGV